MICFFMGMRAMDWPEHQESPIMRLPEDILLKPILHIRPLSNAIEAIYNLNRTNKQFRTALHNRSLKSELIRQLAATFNYPAEVIHYLVELALANHATLQAALNSRKLNTAFIKNFSNQRSLRTLINVLAKMFKKEPIVVVLQWASLQENVGLDKRIIDWLQRESKKSDQPALTLHLLQQGSSIAGVDTKRAIKLLKSAGIKYQSISDAVKAQDINLLKELFQKPIDPNEGKEFSPALDYIARSIEEKRGDVLDLRFQSAQGDLTQGVRETVEQLKSEVDQLTEMARLLIAKGAILSPYAKKVLRKRLKIK